MSRIRILLAVLAVLVPASRETAAQEPESGNGWFWNGWLRDSQWKLVGQGQRPEAKIVARSDADAAAAPTPGARENLLRYKRSVQSLVSQFVPAGSTIDATLTELAEKWNPLYAAAQKRNLVEDVNALVRDFLRPVRKSFLSRPPDLKRIHALAEQLSTSKALAQIKKRDPLLRYIELYMVRCLQVKQL